MLAPSVLVVGAGPAGLVTAIELARHGVRPIVIERHASTSIFPRATGVSVRSMEILRSYGLEDAVRAGGWRVIARQATVQRLDDRSPVEEGIGFPDDASARAVSPVTAAASSTSRARRSPTSPLNGSNAMPGCGFPCSPAGHPAPMPDCG